MFYFVMDNFYCYLVFAMMTIDPTRRIHTWQKMACWTWFIVTPTLEEGPILLVGSIVSIIQVGIKKSLKMHKGITHFNQA
jgi:hypothetical protein